MADLATDQAILDSIVAVIQARLTGGAVDEYQVADRSLKKMSLMQLEELRSSYERRVASYSSSTQIALARFNRAR